MALRANFPDQLTAEALPRLGRKKMMYKDKKTMKPTKKKMDKKGKPSNPKKVLYSC